ncbi:uncharacterized protein LOC113851134 [Abrus precatorius]|uniref:Uncharacterized protein LOC113851134 n=1 Tax=Abrus precatorius TaxID=3816 RepID=A0A8B8K130_ABRPR|nr:uncharacterized protein LOC113851134 [Abrus precatorius]
MFGRVRASTSSLDSLEGSPSKIIKDDTFSIYEATLMKLKLGAQRDAIACSSSMEMDQDINDCSVRLPCTEETNLKARFTPSSLELVVISPGQGITTMDTDGSLPSVSDHVSTGNSEQRKQSDVSILHFFKIKDHGHDTVSTSGEATTSTGNGSSESVSLISAEYRCTSEVEGIQALQVCELSD